MLKNTLRYALIGAYLAGAQLSMAATFSDIVVLGTSLEDTGSHPTASDSRGDYSGFRYSNGDVAVEKLGGLYGISIEPANQLDALDDADAATTGDVLVYDAAGNTIQYLDANGDPVAVLDASGNPLLDAAGNVVYARRTVSAGGNNFAIADAGTRSKDADSSTYDIHMESQVNSFLGSVNYQADPNALYVVEFGGNDAMASFNASISPTLFNSGGGADEMQARMNFRDEQTQRLIDAGARNFILLNTPDVSLVPMIDELVAAIPGFGFLRWIAKNYTLSVTRQYTAISNNRLASFAQQINQIEGVNAVVFDTYSATNEIINDPASFGLVNVTDRCYAVATGYQGDCDGTNWLFWDHLHPIGAIHTELGIRMYNLIELNF